MRRGYTDNSPYTSWSWSLEVAKEYAREGGVVFANSKRRPQDASNRLVGGNIDGHGSRQQQRLAGRLPADYRFASADAGGPTVLGHAKTAGSQSVTATDPLKHSFRTAGAQRQPIHLAGAI